MSKKIIVKVKTNSKEESIIKKDNFLEVNLKSPKENNKANLELLKLLKKYTGKDVKIKSGFKSKLKIVEVID